MNSDTETILINDWSESSSNSSNFSDDCDRALIKDNLLRICNKIQNEHLNNIISGSYLDKKLLIKLPSGSSVNLFDIVNDLDELEENMQLHTPVEPMELQPNKFDIKLSMLSATILKNCGLNNFVIKPYKMILYKVGDRFNLKNEDNNFTKWMIINLPTNYTGGDLVINNWHVDKSNIKELNFYIFNSDCHFNFLPLTMGALVSIIFKCHNIEQLSNTFEIKQFKQDLVQKHNFTNISIVKEIFFKNTLVYHSNINLLLNVFQDLEISYKHVYFNFCTDVRKTKFVYTKIKNPDYMEDQPHSIATRKKRKKTKFDFYSLISKENKFNVFNIIDLDMCEDLSYNILKSKLFKFEEMRGNNRYVKLYKIKYMEGVLLNPYKNTECTYDDDDDDDTVGEYTSEEEYNYTVKDPDSCSKYTMCNYTTM